MILNWYIKIYLKSWYEWKDRVSVIRHLINLLLLSPMSTNRKTLSRILRSGSWPVVLGSLHFIRLLREPSSIRRVCRCLFLKTCSFSPSFFSELSLVAMAAPATRAEVLKIYKTMLRESGKFSFYNYRYAMFFESVWSPFQ